MKPRVILVSALLLASAGAAYADDMAHGKMLYTSNCMRCHGPSGMGGIGKKLAGDAAYWNVAVFDRAVLTGVDDQNRKMKIMPVFGKVGLSVPHGVIPDDADLNDVQGYLKTFGPAQ